jgi:F-type H+-transporting ATPase subunit b
LGLGIDVSALVAQLINVGLLLLLLYVLAYKPIVRMLDQRSSRIKESMEQAEQIKEQVARTEEQVQQQLDAARREGQAIIARASQMGDRLKEETRQEARQQAEALIERARGEIRLEREQAIDELRREFADLAIMAAEKVVGEALDKRAHRRLIDEVLEESTSFK